MASIPDLGTRDAASAAMPARNASNGVAPGQKGQLLKGSGAIGGAQEAGHQPTKVAHPQGPFVDAQGNRFKVDSK
jgi:hypothetical protein